MKITDADGNQYKFEGPISGPCFFIAVEIAAPHSGKFHKALALIDTGCDTLTVPENLLEEFGIFHDQRLADTVTANTTNGKINEDVVEVAIRVPQVTGESILFQGPATVNKTIEYVILGTSILRFFIVTIRNDEVFLQFDPKAVAAAQREAKIPSNKPHETQLHKQKQR